MHLMLDFETLGNQFDTAVLSLGAVAFNREKIISKTMWEFDIPEQLALKRSVTGSTLSWWAAQNDLARKVFQDNDFKVKVAQFFPQFEIFCDKGLKEVGEKRDELKPWGNGANFDIVILEDLYRRHHENHEFAIPWKFWNVWCFRTFNNLTKCRDLIPKRQTHGVKHNALDDALFQAECVRAFWNKGK